MFYRILLIVVLFFAGCKSSSNSNLRGEDEIVKKIDKDDGKTTNEDIKKSQTPPKNLPPVVISKPITYTNMYDMYRYTPKVVDPNRDAKLTFSIQNKPSWAEFNQTTGELYGVAESEGNFSNIIITVSDEKYTVKFDPFDIVVKKPLNLAHI